MSGESGQDMEVVRVGDAVQPHLSARFGLSFEFGFSCTGRFDKGKVRVVAESVGKIVWVKQEHGEGFQAFTPRRM